jgi:hypothetical protein
MNFIVFYDKIYLSDLDSKSGQNKPANGGLKPVKKMVRVTELASI